MIIKYLPLAKPLEKPECKPEDQVFFLQNKKKNNIKNQPGLSSLPAPVKQSHFTRIGFSLGLLRAKRGLGWALSSAQEKHLTWLEKQKPTRTSPQVGVHGQWGIIRISISCRQHRPRISLQGEKSNRIKSKNNSAESDLPSVKPTMLQGECKQSTSCFLFLVCFVG